jgi:hypothetical protein
VLGRELGSHFFDRLLERGSENLGDRAVLFRGHASEQSSLQELRNQGLAPT